MADTTDPHLDAAEGSGQEDSSGATIPADRRIKRGAESRRRVRRKPHSEEQDGGKDTQHEEASNPADTSSFTQNHDKIDPAPIQKDPEVPVPVKDGLLETSFDDSAPEHASLSRSDSANSYNSDDGINDSLTNFSQLSASVYGLFGSVASSGFSLLRSSVNTVVKSGLSMWYGETTPEEWHCDSGSDEEEGDEEEGEGKDGSEVKQEVVQSPVVRDKRYLICNELLTTEEAYVNRLSILVEVKGKVMKILQPDVGKAMFQNVEVIHQFHHDNLLPQIKDRIANWNAEQKMGDIMRKLAPFLKLYTEYVKNFEKACQLVDTWEAKSSAFAALLKEVKTSPQYGRLRVQAHMLEPIQRVPRYELLLRDYLKRLPEDSEDRPDTEKAMQLVSEAATHFENMMKRDSNMVALMKLQNELDGPVNIVGPKRELVKRGKLLKVSERTGKTSDKYTILLSDLLLVCSEQSLLGALGGHYKVRHVFELETAAVTRARNNLDVPHTFYVRSPRHVVELAARSRSESDEWIAAIQKAISDCTKNNQTGKRSAMPNMRHSQVGREAPVYVRMNDVSMCMVCGSNFTTLRRKQHCRACGHVVCARCSSHQLKLDYDPGKSQRVCDHCYTLHEGEDGGKVAATLTKGHTVGTCLERALLQLSSDGCKTWTARYFALYDSKMLYSFKAPQDIIPLTSLSLEQCSARLETRAVSQRTRTVLELSVYGKLYHLTDDKEEVLTRWHRTVSELASSQRTSQSSFDSFSLDAQSVDSSQDADIENTDLDSLHSHGDTSSSLDTQSVGGISRDSGVSL